MSEISPIGVKEIIKWPEPLHPLFRISELEFFLFFHCFFFRPHIYSRPPDAIESLRARSEAPHLEVPHQWRGPNRTCARACTRVRARTRIWTRACGARTRVETQCRATRVTRDVCNGGRGRSGAGVARDRKIKVLARAPVGRGCLVAHASPARAATCAACAGCAPTRRACCGRAGALLSRVNKKIIFSS